MIRRVVSACLLLSGLLTVCSVARAGSDLEVLAAQGNVFVVFGPSGNTTVQIGPEGPLIVDTQPAAQTDQILEAIRRVTARPIRHIVLTNGTDQAAGGAANLAKAGRYVRLIDSIDPRGLDARASIMAHVNVLNRMSAAKAPSDSWPTDTYFVSKWSIFSNGEAVQLLHAPTAQTDGDTIVFFRRSDVISTGAVFDASAYPRFDVNQGGSVDGLISALNDVVEIAVAGENQEGGTVIVPGRGRLADQTDVANYRDMVTIVRDRIRDLIGKGLSLDQVKQAKPTRDYDGLYDTLEWTHDMFVEAVYRDLSRARP